MQTTAMFQYFCLDDWVPEDHLLRAVDEHIDLRPIREQLRPLYSEIGRPSIDPEVLLRILLIGYLYGITSERRLLDEIGLNLAYRWFTGLGFDGRRQLPWPAGDNYLGRSWSGLRGNGRAFSATLKRALWR